LRPIGTPESTPPRGINDTRLDAVINNCKDNETTGVEDETAVWRSKPGAEVENINATTNRLDKARSLNHPPDTP